MLSFSFEILKYQRRQRGLTQAQWAALINVSTSKIGKIERGDISPTVQELCKIASICEVTDINIYFHERIDAQNEIVQKS